MHRKAPYTKELFCSKYQKSPGLGYVGNCATLPNFLRGSQGSLITSSVGCFWQKLIFYGHKYITSEDRSLKRVSWEFRNVGIVDLKN